MFINRYVNNLKPYRLASHKAWLNSDSNILKLDWNESTIDPSPLVKQNIISFLNNGKISWYPDVNNESLLKKIAVYCDIGIDNVQYYPSSDVIHECIARAFVEYEDKVLMVSPTYDNFRSTFESYGAKIDFFYLSDDFLFDLDKLKEYLTNSNIRMVYICNPNNPTGTVYSRDTIEHLLLSFPEIMFIIDEAYFEFGGKTSKDLVIKYQNILITRTFSKAFGLASFRIGYVISSGENIKILSKVRNPKNINMLSQIAAISVLDDVSYMKKYVDDVMASKKYFSEELYEIGLKTYGDGGNFLLLKLNQKSKSDLILFLENKNIYIRDYGHIKKMEDFVRVTIGTKKQMEQVVLAIKEFYEK